MKEASLRVTVIYQHSIAEFSGLDRVLTNAGLVAEQIRFEDWLNTRQPHGVGALLLVLDRCKNFTPIHYTLLDLGLPLLLLMHGNHGFQALSFPASVKRLMWPVDKSRIAGSLRDLCAQPRPIPLHIPKISGMEPLNAISIYGVSHLFLNTVQELRKFSRSLAPVLLQGETGTGKELAARALHYLGHRRDGPFVPVNCSSLPDALFENELFGHSKGAYTGAQDNHAGLLAHAAGGTLFLDEIDSLQPRAQACLLRYLQDKKYRPLGSTKLLSGETFVVAASNRDLNDMVRKNQFREDLLYRINTITVNLPPLRNRPEDIGLLARVFLRKLSKQYDQPPKTFHPNSFKWLEAQRWPGNVRELEGCIHRAFLLGETPFVRIGEGQPDHRGVDKACVLMPNQLRNFSFKEMRDEVIRDFESQYLHQLMLATHGNVSLAARLANKERRCLGKLLKKHGIDREEYTGKNDMEDQRDYANGLPELPTLGNP